MGPPSRMCIRVWSAGKEMDLVQGPDGKTGIYMHVHQTLSNCTGHCKGKQRTEWVPPPPQPCVCMHGCRHVCLCVCACTPVCVCVCVCFVRKGRKPSIELPFLERHDQYLCTQNRIMTYQRHPFIQVYLGEPVSFLGSLVGAQRRGYLQGQAWPKNSCFTNLSHFAWVTAFL
jgi:hypothetical protein